MARKKKPKRKSTMQRAHAVIKHEPLPEEIYKTVGVRFIDGNDPYKLFTYQVKKEASLYLGMELIADTPRGPKLCVCVRLDAEYNPDDFPAHGLKVITRKAAPL